MRKWRGGWTIGLVLLALLASVLPSSAWSCPMTGRVGSAAICPGMGAPCVGGASTCCRPVTLPPGDVVPHGEARVLWLLPVPKSLQIAPPEICVAPVFLPFKTPIVLVRFNEESETPTFQWRSRHGPLLGSGRAPPVA